MPVWLLPADGRGDEGGSHVDPEPVTHPDLPMSLRVRVRNCLPHHSSSPRTALLTIRTVNITELPARSVRDRIHSVIEAERHGNFFQLAAGGCQSSVSGVRYFGF